jgi:hypothetical protein
VTEFGQDSLGKKVRADISGCFHEGHMPIETIVDAEITGVYHGLRNIENGVKVPDTLVYVTYEGNEYEIVPEHINPDEE